MTFEKRTARARKLIRLFVSTAAICFSLTGILLGQETRRVAVTFDDLPATGGTSTLERLRYVNDRLLKALEREKVPAIGFVNESKLFVNGEIDERTAILDKWLEGGHLLGNHTFSHIAIDRASFEQYKEDLIRGETVTRMLLSARGLKLKYFRHTQLRTGPTAEYRSKLSELLASRGYTVAPVTIDNNEYIFAALYTDALRNGDRDLAERIAVAYVEYMESVFEHFEKLSHDLLGYEVRQILLLHANELNADHFGRLAAMMRKRGYRFVTLDDALRDKAYTLPDALSTRGISWIHRWTIAKGQEVREEPDVPDWISERFRRR
jgi:peptidoglycan/xylan/chitin deacetylase (PgdA/CDA1 family)